MPRTLLNSLFEKRLDDKGAFDELLSKEPVMVHIEKMDDDYLVVTLSQYTAGPAAIVEITAEDGELFVQVREEAGE